MLAEIVATKREELRRLRERADGIGRAAAAAPPPRDFRAALAGPGNVSLIAECKRRSPGAGAIRPGLDPAELARAYAAAGAAAMSVLTDRDYFGGAAADLRAARAAAPLPILRKDFTLEPLHVVEARAMGADAVLLIVRILSDEALGALLREVRELGMTALVEVHDAEELRRAVASGAGVIGINNRDLATFTTDLGTTLRLLEEIPPETVVVSESGIRSRADVERLGEAGVDAVLVGESLLAAPEPGVAARGLVGVERSSATRLERAEPPR